MTKKRDHTLDLLLDLDGLVHAPSPGYWIKYEAKTVPETDATPHGIKYSLTLQEKERSKDMKTVKVGIMPLKEFQAYTKAIVTGKHKRKRGEPKIWFNSIETFAKVLSDQNRELLALIAKENPKSISELSRLSGRAQSNLSRTLKNMERYGFVTMKKGERGSKRPFVPYSDIVLDMSIGGNAQSA